MIPGEIRVAEAEPLTANENLATRTLPQEGRLVFGLGSADQWAKADGQLAELEFEVLNASGLAEAELKLTHVEFTPD